MVLGALVEATTAATTAAARVDGLVWTVMVPATLWTQSAQKIV